VLFRTIPGLTTISIISRTRNQDSVAGVPLEVSAIPKSLDDFIYDGLKKNLYNLMNLLTMKLKSKNHLNPGKNYEFIHPFYMNETAILKK